MEKDGFIEGFFNSELLIKASENLGQSVLMARFSLYFLDILCTKTKGNFLMPCF